MPRNVSQVIVEQLGGWGIRHLFGVMGETILPLVDAVRRQDRVRFVATQHEQAAAFAASAYGKLTGRPAACIATGGPGATSLMTGIYDAQADHAPVLAITGQVRRAWRHENAWQEIDAHALFEPVSVFNAEVETPAQAPVLLAGALQAAASRSGVAHLSVPMDIQGMEADVDPILPEGHLNWSAAVPGEDALRQAVRLLQGASRPLVLAGRGARDAGELLLQLAQRLGAPVLTTCRSKGLIPADEPLSMGIPGRLGTPLASSLLHEADTILVVGCSLSQSTTGNWQLIRPQQQMIQIDADRSQMGRVFAVDVGLWGEAAPTLRRLLALMPEGQPHTSWGDLQGRKAELRDVVARKATRPSTPIKPQFVVHALQAALAPDAIVALDAGDHALFMCQQFEATRQQFVMSYHLGSTGFALPAAFAAALAFPERQVAAVVGDGGLAFSLGELLTAAEHNLPITMICVNNARLGMINSQEEQLGMAPFFTELPAVNYASVAQACGVRGVRVEEPAALAGTLQQALAAHSPTVIDVAVDPLERESTALEAMPAVAPA